VRVLLPASTGEDDDPAEPAEPSPADAHEKGE
jgi:hypothetical protein